MLSLGPRIRECRKSKGISLRKFSAMIGISPTYLSMIERETESPTAETLKRISAILDMNSDELMGQAGKIPPDVVEIFLGDPTYWARTIREMAKVRKRLAGRKPADFSDCGIPHLVED